MFYLIRSSGPESRRRHDGDLQYAMVMMPMRIPAYNNGATINLPVVGQILARRMRYALERPVLLLASL
jgi:hypothetical protein